MMFRLFLRSYRPAVLQRFAFAFTPPFTLRQAQGERKKLSRQGNPVRAELVEARGISGLGSTQVQFALGVTRQATVAEV